MADRDSSLRMLIATPHPRESQRLHALHALGLLDTPPDEALDALADALRQAFDVPMVLVSLVDEQRQWFKCHRGLQVPETGREISFCSHTILEADLLVVEDATRDGRFADNPLVTGDLHLRFYAGVPIRTDAGLPVGTLCLLSDRPRSFTLTERTTLQHFGRVVERLLTSSDSIPRRQAIARLEAAIGHLGEGVVFHGRDGAILTSNPAACAILGSSAEQLHGRDSLDPGWQTVHADGTPWPGHEHPAMQVLATGQPCLGQVMGVRRPDGSQSWILVNAMPIFEQGRLTGACASFQDLSPLRAAEHQALQSERRFRNLVASVPGLVFQAHVDNAGQRVLDHVSEFSLTLLGLAPDAVLTWPGGLEALAHADDGPALARMFDDAQAALRPLDWTGRFLNQVDGNLRWVQVRARPALDNDGLLRWHGLMLDVSERVRAEQALRASEAHSQALMSALPDLMMVVSAGGQILDARVPAGFIPPTSDKPGPVGHNVRDFLPAPAAERLTATLADVLATGAPAQLEIEVLTAAGPRDHEIRLRALDVEQAMLLVRDISERKTLERLQEHFVATVSHELRTPLTSIYGALRLLQAGADSALGPESGDLLAIAQTNTQRLMRLVNDILDVERAASGRLNLELAPHDLGLLVSEAVAAAHLLATGLEVTYDWQAPGMACPAQVDAFRVQQVVTNLLSNAVKHSPAGGRVGVRLLPEARHWRLEVENHGEPIPAAFRPRLFERFAMADVSDGRRRGGSGLGLSISRSLVERMQGTVDFVSDEQRTCFFVRLPRLAHAGD